MASDQTPSGDYVKQSERKVRRGVESGNEGETEHDIRRNNGSQSNSTRRGDLVSDFQDATGSQDFDRGNLRRGSIDRSTRTARNQAFDGISVESGSEGIGFVNDPRLRNGEGLQGLMSSPHSQNIRQHRDQPTSSRTGLDRSQNPHLMRDQHQPNPNSSNPREQAPKVGRKVDQKGAYWKPSPGAGCQKAPPPGGNRGFNPSGTVPDYGGLEIWHDDEGKVVERLGRGGKDDGSFDN